MLTLGGYENRCDMSYLVTNNSKKKEEVTMISAADARAKANDEIEKIVSCEIRLIESKVIQACEEGQTTTTIKCSLQDKTIVKLQELGYDVVPDMDRNDMYYTISWTGDWREE